VTSRAQPQTIDTARVEGRRILRFNTIDDVLADVERLVEAERRGTLVRLGNWSLGQTLGHLATWVNFSFTGAPTRPPMWVKLLLRMMKKKFLHGSMRSGVRIPGIEGGTLGTEPMSLDEGLQAYRGALERLRREVPQKPNVIFGPLAHDEWIALNLRHAELHLSFMRPK
jgi:hypothetical protein